MAVEDSLSAAGNAVPDNEKSSSKDSHPVEYATDTPVEVPVVSPEVEKRLLKKLDRRIIPICCWIYLMNFMDRGTK